MNQKKSAINIKRIKIQERVGTIRDKQEYQIVVKRENEYEYINI